MKLIVGLGNPGIEYQFTYHNLGFLTVDVLANEQGVQVSNRHCKALTGRTSIGAEPVLLAKPETFMNLSGLAVRELVGKYEVEPGSDLIVIYDELDLPFGTVRIKQRGGSAGHNGLESILNALGTDEFLRIRIGIAPEKTIADGAKYVLSQIKRSQEKVIDEALDTAAEAAKAIVTDGPQAAMNRFNRRDKEEIE
ncbi:MAG TPA: aminoacyl-tRNA hydrolase [Terriglobales bacterium]|nr:aminoacyl-tRNA hydrolase [Terriglobales bacterium]